MSDIVLNNENIEENVEIENNENIEENVEIENNEDYSDNNGTPSKKVAKIKKWDAFSIIVFVVLTLYLISLGIPLLWGFLTSFKDRVTYLTNTLGFPKINGKMFDAYIKAIKEGFVLETPNTHRTVKILEMSFNSILYSLGSAFFFAIGNCLVAYCAAQFSRFKISTVYTTVVIVVMALPIVGSEASSLQMYMNLGFYNNMFGMWLGKMSFLNAYYLIFLEAFKAVPKDYSEAAYIDGAGNVTLFLKLMVPFVQKTFMTVMLLFFITYWNEYQVPLLYMPDIPTLSYGLFRYTNNWNFTSVPATMAGCMIVFIPVFVVFCVFQKKLLGNIMLGGVKE